ncbi:hypothetical protein [Thermoanaerobacter thermocopriae]|uniref:hypothetical protein n=1 Tax=Thermoanaerobacter thermocopriae TaxID=29350 RepID=UPI0006D0E8B0|nr:hypothetical protein [Thermoanaerobacter thermocopriae]
MKAYSTIYWETYDINGYEHITLTAVSGGWIVEDPTVWLSSREVYVSQNGRYEGYPKQLVSYTKYFIQHLTIITTIFQVTDGYL